MLMAVLGVVLVLALGWKFYQVFRAPHDRPLRAVTLCITCAAISFPFGLRAGAQAFDSLAGDGAAKLLQNALLLGTVYWLMCFYLYSAADGERGRIRARKEAVVLALAVGIITLATVVTPPVERSHTYSTANMQSTAVAAFYLAAGLYLVYALAMALRWTWRYARVSQRPLSTGLWLAALAMAAMVLAGTARAVLIVIRWYGAGVPPVLIIGAKLLLDIAIPVFVVGVSYPGVATRLAALRVWWHHRRMYRRLHPLWSALHQAFPEDALNRVPSGRWSEALRIRGVHRRYYRRVIECRDGLVRVSPYLVQPDFEAGAIATASPETLADRIRTALRAHAQGAPAPSQAVPVALPTEDNLDADVRQLAEISDALRTA